VPKTHASHDNNPDIPIKSRTLPREWSKIVLMLPLLLFLATFFVFPMLGLFLRSVSAENGSFTLAHYNQIFSTSIYLRLFWNTFQIASIVTFVTLLIGYGFAYCMSAARPAIAGILMFCTLLPFFTSILVRTYGWMIILGPEGLLNQLLIQIGLSPRQLLYNRVGVLIGMVYALLPYMVLTLYSVFHGIDKKLMRAASNLGASRVQAFIFVFWPLSLPGVAGGCLLVFIMALGYFVTPSLMGGGGDQMIAMLIFENIDRSLNWEFAAALSTILLILTLFCLLIYGRLVGLQRLLESRR
jgi:putative spermidine/putrescine transport system permease protein